MSESTNPVHTDPERANPEQAHPELVRLRGSIDNLDSALVHLLAERFKVTQRVGQLKATQGLPPADPEREKRQIERLRALAMDAQLDPEFAEKFLNFIVTEVVRHHEQIARGQQS
ncbi:chorismate mutase [Luteococcus sanguinis]|uniref:Chorismate mutase n=1 Tax=Luteococcus sanguinis TaxID=174038 RepID=A0ABW1WZC9_9ACTN